VRRRRGGSRSCKAVGSCGGNVRGEAGVTRVRDLYIILAVIGWAWCLVVAAFLWVRLRREPRLRRGATDGPAFHGAPEGRPEAEA
jgi:hypothetical protein